MTWGISFQWHLFLWVFNLLYTFLPSITVMLSAIMITRSVISLCLLQYRAFPCVLFCIDRVTPVKVLFSLHTHTEADISGLLWRKSSTLGHRVANPACYFWLHLPCNMGSRSSAGWICCICSRGDARLTVHLKAPTTRSLSHGLSNLCAFRQCGYLGSIWSQSELDLISSQKSYCLCHCMVISPS